MATKITVVLEDDLVGGPAEETVRFGLGGEQYEIDLNPKTPRRSVSTSRRLPNMPVKQGVDSGAGQRGPQQAVSAAATSGPGRGTRALRSAAAGGSPRVLSSSTKPPPKDPDPPRMAARGDG
jgi:hypothetical protein